MHSPWCLPVNATIPTIALPKKNDVRVIPSGTVETNMELRPGFALWVALVADAVIELKIDGADSHVLMLAKERTPCRIVSPERHPDIVITCTDASSVWLEDLEALKPPGSE